MKIQIPYGKSQLIADLPLYDAEFIVPKNHQGISDPLASVSKALLDPLGDIQLPQAGQTVSIAINDKTRPVPHEHLLPPLLDWLKGFGLRKQDIVFVIASGTHPVMPREEYSWILAQSIVDQYRIICHDASDDTSLRSLGTTSRGTPVFINTDYMQADYHIVVGNIEPHQFMGFSGGVKSAAIGLADKMTINHNHAMMSDTYAIMGEYERNPARQDVEEIGQMMRIDFALNAILNGKKQIVRVLAGHAREVIQAAIPQVKAIYQVPVKAAFDLMIVSPGGHPKDINVYQAQKALAHAALVMKDGGSVIVCAACPDGSGSTSYEKWISDATMRDHQTVIARFKQEGFQVGPHKAFQISRDAARFNVMLVSDMPADFVHKLLLNPLPDLQTAIDQALADLPEYPRIGIMPLANATIPML